MEIWMKLFLKYIYKIVLITIFFLTFSACNSNNIELGYIYGNLNNEGRLAGSNGWIYYTISGSGHGLYKMKSDGSEQTKINTDKAFWINIVDDYIYYFNNNDAEQSGGICKLKMDGSNKTLITRDVAYSINVIGSWIYYSNISDGGKIYKILNDGSKKTKINDDKSSSITVLNDVIYYSNDSDKGKPYRINTDGSNRKCLGNDCSFSFTPVNKSIYFINADDSFKIYTMGLNGENITRITKDGVYKFNADNNALYYIEADIKKENGSFIIKGNETKSIYKVNHDGSAKTLLRENYNNGHLHLIDDYVFYFSVQNKDSFEYLECSRMKKDGSDVKTLYRYTEIGYSD